MVRTHAALHFALVLVPGCQMHIGGPIPGSLFRREPHDDSPGGGSDGTLGSPSGMRPVSTRVSMTQIGSWRASHPASFEAWCSWTNRQPGRSWSRISDPTAQPCPQGVTEQAWRKCRDNDPDMSIGDNRHLEGTLEDLAY